jgi:hypothetical protein
MWYYIAKLKSTFFMKTKTVVKAGGEASPSVVEEEILNLLKTRKIANVKKALKIGDKNIMRLPVGAGLALSGIEQKMKLSTALSPNFFKVGSWSFWGDVHDFSKSIDLN